MSIFARRRIADMLLSLQPWLTEKKRREYVRLLESRTTKDSLAAEAELAIVWALSKSDTGLVIEPQDIGGRRNIDALVPNLFASGPAAIEVTSISDDTAAGRTEIERAANIIAQFCSSTRRRSGSRLSFYFAEMPIRRAGQWLERKPFVTPDYVLSDVVKGQLTQWLADERWPSPKRIRLHDRNICVDVTAQEFSYRRISAHSSVPAVIYHPENNPIFRAIERKAKQLRAVANGYLRCIFIVDVGCHVLTDLKPLASGSQIAPADVIASAREKFKLDLVVILSPTTPTSPGMFTNLYPSAERQDHWRVTVFLDRPEDEMEYLKGVNLVAGQLPPPRLDASLARQLHEQGAFTPQASDAHVPASYRFNPINGTSMVKVSARLLQEFLAGKIDRASFDRKSFGQNFPNIFESNLSQGRILKSVCFENAGLDQDDDWIVFDFVDDPAAKGLS